MATLKDLRLQRHMSQRDLATQAKVTVNTVSSLENGRHQPTYKTIRKLARALNVEPTDITF